MKVRNRKITWKQARYILLWLALPLIVGILIAAAVPRPVIGLITLNDAIYSTTATEMITQITYAREHANVRAVVYVVDSPGGTVADTEGVYQEMFQLRQDKPIVTSIGSMSASGAYYLSVGTDYIYANPSSQVGNVGVIGYLPPAPFIFEEIISTGPYKLWGEPRDTVTREIDMVKQGFFQAVLLGRGDRLKDPEMIRTGRIWPGSEALRLGLIDGLGSVSDAIQKAAELARVRNYRVKDLAELAGLGYNSSSSFFQSREGVTLPYPNEPGLYLLYIPPLPAGK